MANNIKPVFYLLVHVFEALNVLLKERYNIDSGRYTHYQFLAYDKASAEMVADLKGLCGDVVTDDGVCGQYSRTEDELLMAYTMLKEKYGL